MRHKMIKLTEIMNEAIGLKPEDCQPGKTYEVGYRNHKWTATFKGWFIKDGPRMKWHDDEAGDWEAYMFRGVMCVGSSADKLIIYGKATTSENTRPVRKGWTR